MSFAATRKRKKLKAVDLYAGIGGWSLGLRMAGVEVISSYEWWPHANLTNSRNNRHPFVECDVRSLDPASVPRADIVVGSPPCTQFSLANRGGKGDILEGLKDVEKFLEVVDHMRPEFWALENVPRLAAIFQREINQGGILHRFAHLAPVVAVLDVSEFGVPQRRKRAIVGRFDLDLLLSYRPMARTRTLGHVLSCLSADPPVDPVYGSVMSSGTLSEHIREEALSEEEERLNRDAKSNHPVYNGMSFPDSPLRPSRTVTATCTRVSRESIVVGEGETFRRLTLRERASLQSFPASYQFYAPTHPLKQKMVGNAIPPLLTYHLAHAMLGTGASELPCPSRAVLCFTPPSETPPPTVPDKPGKSYPVDRRFRASIPGLRFKSGMRFELSNSFKNGRVSWRVRFFYGNSKSIREIELDDSTLADVKKLCGSEKMESKALKSLTESGGVLDCVNSDTLQKVWSGRQNRCSHPHDLSDSIGRAASLLIGREPMDCAPGVVGGLIKSEGDPPGGQKVIRNAKSVLAGILVGSLVNGLFKESERPAQKKKGVSN